MIALPQRARSTDHPPALGREEPRDLGSDAAGGAGHHHDLAVELFHLYLARLVGAAFPYRSPRAWGRQPPGGPAARTTPPINNAAGPCSRRSSGGQARSMAAGMRGGVS